MRTYNLSVVVVIFVLCCIVNSVSADSPDIEMSICRNLVGPQNDPGPRVEIFSTSDEKIICHVKFREPLHNSHKIKWQWCPFEGECSSTTSVTPHPASLGRDKLENHSAWCSIDVRTAIEARLAGRWCVYVFVDEEFLARDWFNIGIVDRWPRR
jgi:hypothetical protein